MSKYNYYGATIVMELLDIIVCIDVEDIYRILTLHILIPHLISAFEVLVATVEVFLTPKLNSPFCLSHDREVHSIQGVHLLKEGEMENQTALH